MRRGREEGGLPEGEGRGSDGRAAERPGRTEREGETQRKISRQRNAYNYRGREREKESEGGVTDKEIKPEVDS